MIQEILADLEKKFKENDDKAQELFLKLISNKEMSLEDRIHYSMQHMKYSSKSGVYDEIIWWIKCYIENENCCKEKDKAKSCNCEKNHDKVNTEEDNEEFEKIKKQLEVLKKYVAEEIKDSIDNINFWYENQPNGEKCSLNDYKKYIKAIIVVVYKTKRESDVWNKIMDQIVIISRMINVEK